MTLQQSLRGHGRARAVAKESGSTWTAPLGTFLPFYACRTLLLLPRGTGSIWHNSKHVAGHTDMLCALLCAALSERNGRPMSEGMLFHASKTGVMGRVAKTLANITVDDGVQAVGCCLGRFCTPWTRGRQGHAHRGMCVCVGGVH